MKRYFLLVLSLVSLLFTACENSLILSHDDSAYLHITTGAGYSSDSRTLFPTVPSLSSFTDFTLSGTLSPGGSAQTLATASSLSALESKQIKVNTGVWDFTLTAVSSGVTYTADISAFTVVAGTNNLSFILEPDNSLLGQFSLTLSFPATDVTKVEASLEDQTSGTVVLAAEELTVSSGKIVYAKNSLTPGTYRIVINFYGGADSSLYLNTYRELVHIAPGLTSSANRSITSLNDVYTISYHFNGGEIASGTAAEAYTRRLSTDIDLPVAKYEGKYFCGWYTNSACTGSALSQITVGMTGDYNLYAKWLEPVVYVNGTSGDNTNGGFVADDAVETLNEAFVRIKETQDNAQTLYADTDLKNWTVKISNRVTGCSVMNDTDVPVNSLTIEGTTGSSTDMLDADGEAYAVLDVDSSVSLTIKKVQIRGGTNLDGGGLSIHGSTNVTIDSCLITQNTATRYGGGIYKEGTGWLALSDTQVSQNKAEKPLSSTDPACGGGIYIMSASTVSLSGLTGYPVHIENNEATDDGGGIVSHVGLVFRYGCIEFNTAGANAGGMQLIGESATLYENVVVEGNEAGADGGGLYVSGSSATLTLSGATVAANKATENGGGVFVSSGSFLSLTEDAVIGNDAASASATAVNTNHSNSAKKGGGVYNEGTLLGGSDAAPLDAGGIFYNYATEAGGGIYSTGAVAFVGGHVSYNATGSSGSGGGLNVTLGSGNINCKSTTFKQNFAGLDGGGLFVQGRDAFLMGCSLTDNAASQNGGGLYASNAAITVARADTRIEKNTATSQGGGLYIGNGGSLSMTVGLVSNNEAASGGGLCISSGAMTPLSTISGTTFQENKVSSAGGAIAVMTNASGLPCALSYDDVNIIKNESNSQGGGLYIDQACSVTMISGNLSQNTAKGTQFAGGGVYNMNGTFDFEGGTIVSNKATAGSGGGICNYTSSGYSANGHSALVTVSAGTINSNTAAKDGGGIYNGASSTFTMTGGLIGLTDMSGANTASLRGQGVFNDGFMNMEGSAHITANNDVYLSEYVTDTLHPANRLINVTGTLTETVAATITPAVYRESLLNATPVVTGTSAMSQVTKFAVTPDAGGNDWYVFWVGTRGCIMKVGMAGEIRYISESGVDSTGRGLAEALPCKTLEYAVNSFTNKNAVDSEGNPTNIVYVLSDYTLTSSMYNETTTTDVAFNMIGRKTDASPVVLTCNIGFSGSAFNVKGQNITMTNFAFEQNPSVTNSYAAVCVEGGNLTMNDCTMTGLKASGVAAIHVGKSASGSTGTVTLSNVTIRNNVSVASAGGWRGGAINVKDGILVIAGKTIVKDNTNDLGNPANVWIGYSDGSNPPVFNPLVIKTDLTGSQFGISCGIGTLTSNKAITQDYVASGNSTNLDDIQSIFTSDGGNGIAYSGGEVCLTAGYYFDPADTYDYDALVERTTDGCAGLVLQFKNSSGVVTLAESLTYTVKAEDGTTIISGTDTNNSAVSLDLPPLQNMVVSVSGVKDGITALFSQTVSVAATDVWVSPSGSDTISISVGLGTLAYPFASINHALTFINNASADATIHVSGQVSGNALIDSVNAATLTITGTSASSDKLNGNNAGATLTVDTGVPVTVKNLTITGGRKVSSLTGSAAQTDPAGYGGGLFILAGSDVTLASGCTVTGNTASLGGGLYNSGTLLIDGATIKDNTANKGGGIYAGGTAILSGGTIEDNTATYGSGMYVSVDSEVAMTNTACLDSSNDAYIETDGSILLNASLDASTVTAATITPQSYAVGTTVLSGSAVGTQYTKFIVTPQLVSGSPVSWAIDGMGKLVKPDAGGLSVVDDDVTLTISSTTVSSSASTKLRFTVILDEGAATETDLTTTIPAADWTIKVFSGTSEITSMSYFTTTLSSTERSLTVSSGIPVGTIFTVYVSATYNGRSYGGSYTITVT